MNAKISLCLVVAFAALAVSAQPSGVRELRDKYRSMMVDGSRQQVGAGMMMGAGATASAGPQGVSSAASAIGSRYYGQPQQQQQQAVYAPVARQQPRRAQSPRQPRVQHQFASPAAAQYYGGTSAATAGGYYGQQPAPVARRREPLYAEEELEYYEPEVDVDPVYGQYPELPAAYNYDYQQQQPRRQQPQRQQPRRFRAAHQPARFAKSAQPARHAYAPAATSSAAAAVGGGAAVAAAAVSGGAHHFAQQQQHAAPEHNQHVVDVEESHEGFHEPETVSEYAAASGTYANDGKNGAFEEGSYVRNTESLEKHEDGREDGDHYYNAQSYGKTNDVNKYTAFNNDDEDVVHTPNLFRKKKSATNYVSSFNKAHRETGSGVVAHDKHSASYNKNSKKVKENVDQKYSKTSDGSVTTKDKNTHADIDEEDEEEMDTRGLGTFVGVDGVAHAKRQVQPVAAAATAAAGAAGVGAAAASSTFAQG